MSGSHGHLVPQSTKPSIQGTIRTDNPELVKLLQDNSSNKEIHKRYSPRKFPADTDRKELSTHVLDLRSKSPAAQHSKNIKNLLNNQKKIISKLDHLKENNLFITDAGDARRSYSEKEGKENKSDGIKETDFVNNSDSLNNRFWGVPKEDSKGHVDEKDKRYLQKQGRFAAETTVTRTLTTRKTIPVDDPSSLSDIIESDCETVGSSSSELARLRTPSQSSLNADFEESSLPSSPVHLSQIQSDRSSRSTRSQSHRDRGKDSGASTSDRESVTPVEHIIRAGATPYYRKSHRSPSENILEEAQDNSDCRKTPEVITPVESPVQGVASSGTAIPQEDIPSSAICPPAEQPVAFNLQAVKTDVITSVSPPAATGRVPQNLSRQAGKSDRLYPTFSQLSPGSSPRSSQSLAITSKVQKLTKDTASDPQDTLTPRVHIPYQSQRLKSRGDTGKRSTSVSIVQDSLDSQNLDIERDSLEISQPDNTKNNLNISRDKEVTRQGVQVIQSPLKDSLIADSTKSKLSNSTHALGEQVNNIKQEASAVASDRKAATVDLHKQNPLPREGHQPSSGNTRLLGNSQQHESLGTVSVHGEGQEFSAPLMSSQRTEEGDGEHTEFVLRTNPHKQAAINTYPAHGSSQRQDSSTDHVVAAGSVRGSNRTTPSVRKVYIESPVFTKEEEDVYRFVNSRLGDSKEGMMDTYRELDMVALDYQEKHAARLGGQKHVRYVHAEGRYEDADDQALGREVKQLPGFDVQARPSGKPQQEAQREDHEVFGQHQEDKENQFHENNTRSLSYQPQAQKHPGLLQDPSQAGTSRQARSSNGSLHPQNQTDSAQLQHVVNSNQPGDFNQLQGPTSKPQVAYNPHHGRGSNPHQDINYYQVPTNQQTVGEGRFQLPQFPRQQQQPPNTISQQPPYYQHHQQQLQQQQQRDPMQHPEDNKIRPVRGLSLPTGPTYDPMDEEELKRETSYQQGLRQRIENRTRRTQQTTVPELAANATRRLQEPDSRGYVEDSLDDQDDDNDDLDDMAESFGSGFAHDSLNLQQQYQEPPQLQYPQQQQQQYRQQLHQQYQQQPQQQYSVQPEQQYSQQQQYPQQQQQYPQQQQQYPQQQYPQPVVNPFRNPPPPPPQNVASFDDDSYPGYRSSRLEQVQFDSEDFTDRGDIRQPRVNPQIRPRFYQPQLDQQRQYLTHQYVDEDPPTQRSVADPAYEDSQRYEDRGVDEGQHPMEAVQPKPPKYDYVANNKEDLGKPSPKSYTKIHEITKEEKERLQEVFIQPKLKPKGSVKKRGQDQGQQRTPVFSHQPEQDGYEYMTPAEQVWAQRSTTLAKKFDGTGVSSHRGRRKGPGSLQKFSSDSSLSQTSLPHRRQSLQANFHHHQQQQQEQPQQQHQQRPQQQQQQQRPPLQLKQPPPDARAFITDLPTPLSGVSAHSQPVPPHATVHQHPTELTVQPISQQILTQDGQRISVDVNLKLISPPSVGEGPLPYQYQLQQYPHPHYPQPQYYVGHQRQYPAVISNYDDSGGENAIHRMPALEYPPQEFYDSDSNDYRNGSPRERYSADEALRILSQSRTDLNPYGKIPPIGRSQGDDHPSSAPAPDQAGSYMDMYMKQKVKDTEQPWYKVYGLKDYRRMQKEVRLGTLGPDLDSDAVKERREKVTRQQDYAKTVMEKNRSQLAHRRPPAFPRPNEDDDIISRRRLAIEYAKSVPKPTVRVQPNEFNNYEISSEKSPIAKHHRRDPAGRQNHNSPRHQLKKDKEMDILDLEKLRQRYEEDKANEALIRRNTHSFNREGYY